MAGFFEELVAELKIVPSPDNLDNINSHIQQIQALISSIGGQFANLNLSPAIENIRQFAQGLDQAKQTMAGVATEMMGMSPDAAVAKTGEWVNGLKAVVEQHAMVQQQQGKIIADVQNVSNQYWIWKDITGRVMNLVKGAGHIIHSWAEDSLRTYNDYLLLESRTAAAMQGYAAAVEEFGTHSQKMWLGANTQMEKAQLLARDFIAQVNAIQSGSAFSKAVLGDVGQQLLANLGDFDQALVVLNQLQRIALGDEKRLNGLTTAFNNITRATKITAMNLRQFSSASGLNLTQAIHNIVGGTDEQFAKALRKGLIPKEVVYQAIKDLSDSLGEAPDQIAKQWDAKWGNMIESLQMKIGKAIEPILNAFVPLMNKISDLDFTSINIWLIQFSKYVEEAMPFIGLFIDRLFQLMQVVIGVATLLMRLAAMFAKVMTAVPGLTQVVSLLIVVLGARGLLFILQVLGSKLLQITIQIYNMAKATNTAGRSFLGLGKAAGATGPGLRVAMVGIRGVTIALIGMGKAVAKNIALYLALVVAFQVLSKLFPESFGMPDMDKEMAEFNKQMEEIDRQMRMDEARAAQEEKKEQQINNYFDMKYVIDEKGKSKFSKEMLDEMVRSIFNMELIKIVEMSDSGKGNIKAIKAG